MSTTPVKFLRSTFVTLTANLLILFGHWGQELVNLQPHCLQNLIVFWEVNGLLSAIISRDNLFCVNISVRDNATVSAVLSLISLNLMEKSNATIKNLPEYSNISDPRSLEYDLSNEWLLLVPLSRFLTYFA